MPQFLKKFHAIKFFFLILGFSPEKVNFYLINVGKSRTGHKTANRPRRPQPNFAGRTNPKIGHVGRIRPRLVTLHVSVVGAENVDWLKK